ncbi:MAG: hypothetical protein R3344_11505 [Acidobacteriota bacterium]|nr:hypothetical protein [Acidobacteriota bacterium]
MSTRKKRRFRAHLGDLRFVIDQIDKSSGCCLHVYNNGNCLGDHRVASLESAKRMARDAYSVPEDGWEEEG